MPEIVTTRSKNQALVALHTGHVRRPVSRIAVDPLLAVGPGHGEQHRVPCRLGTVGAPSGPLQRPARLGAGEAEAVLVSISFSADDLPPPHDDWSATVILLFISIFTTGSRPTRSPCSRSKISPG